MHEFDTFAPIALHVILALIAGALIGSGWEAWRERRHRKAGAERAALDALRWIHHRR